MRIRIQLPSIHEYIREYFNSDYNKITHQLHVISKLLSPAVPEARDGRYSNAPRPSVNPSVCLSVTFSFRTVTRKRIDLYSQNFAGTFTMSWGCAV